MANRKRAAYPVEEGSEIYTDLLLATLPLLVLSIFFYGMRCAALYAVGVVTANLCDRLVALLRARPFDPFEMSNESFAALLVLMLPATVSYYVVVVGVLAAVLLGKEAFGGYGSYVFHPTAVGYVVAAVSWPEQVCMYPQVLAKPALWGDLSAVATAESPLAALRTGSLPAVSMMDLLTGGYAGGMGATAVVVALGVAVVLCSRRRLKPELLFLFLAFCGAMFWAFSQLAALDSHTQLQITLYRLASNGIPFGAVFFLSDPVTVPKNQKSRLIYVLLLALATVIYSYFGYYDNGLCFALLICNSISGWIDRMGTGTLLPAHTEKKGVAA